MTVAASVLGIFFFLLWINERLFRKETEQHFERAKELVETTIREREEAIKGLEDAAAKLRQRDDRIEQLSRERKSLEASRALADGITEQLYDSRLNEAQLTAALALLDADSLMKLSATDPAPDERPLFRIEPIRKRRPTKPGRYVDKKATK